jgi:hypothetical protein
METGGFSEIIPDFFGNFFGDLINNTYVNLSGNSPVGSFAQGGGLGFGYILGNFLWILNFLVYIILALAVVYFLWGLFKYVTVKDSDGRDEAVKTITYGIIILFVMVSLWSLVAILGRTFGLSRSGPPREQRVYINNLIR